MIDDALTNPPMPDWNELSNQERLAITREVGDGDCGCCQCSCGDSFHIYDEIRKILKVRERRYFEATMAGPPEYNAGPEPTS
jgi:hypothetical protein